MITNDINLLKDIENFITKITKTYGEPMDGDATVNIGNEIVFRLDMLHGNR